MTDRIGIGVLTRLCSRDLVDEVLVETGRREQRSRSLPSRVMVYYVMALTLFFADAYEEVMRKLVDGLDVLRLWQHAWTVPTPGAITQARKRVGAEPLRVLFERVAAPLATRGTVGAWYGRWRIMAVDGVVVDAADTPGNVETFGKPGSVSDEAAFPQLRIVGIGECGTHAVIAAALGPYRSGERELAEQLVEAITPDMLILADRGFYSYALWDRVLTTGAALVWRVSAGIDLPVLQVLPDGSYRSRLISPARRKYINKRKRLGKHVWEEEGLPVRVVEYTLPNRDSDQRYRLLTSITDPDEAPAADLAGLYHQRWEFENTLDELETHQQGGRRVLRSRLPELVEQEAWAMLLTHYAIRHLMSEAADDAGIDPDRLSFIRSLRVVRRQISRQAGFSPSPTQHSDQ